MRRGVIEGLPYETSKGMEDSLGGFLFLPNKKTPYPRRGRRLASAVPPFLAGSHTEQNSYLVTGTATNRDTLGSDNAPPASNPTCF